MWQDCRYIFNENDLMQVRKYYSLALNGPLALPAKKSFEGSGNNRRYSRKTMKSMRNDHTDAIFSWREYR